jgi:hypothetical protein
MLYHENGTTRSITSYNCDSVKHGSEIHFDETGEIEARIRYEFGKRVDTVVVYHRNGTIRAQIPYSNDQKNGTARWFHDNAALKTEALFKDDLPHGGVYMYAREGDTISYAYHVKFTDEVSYRCTVDEGWSCSGSLLATYGMEDHFAMGGSVEVIVELSDPRPNDGYFMVIDASTRETIEFSHSDSLGFHVLKWPTARQGDHEMTVVYRVSMPFRDGTDFTVRYEVR